MSKYFKRWLKQPPRNLTFADYCRLSEEDSTLLLGAYQEYKKKEAKKIGRVEKRKKDKLKKYLEKLHKKEKQKVKKND